MTITEITEIAAKTRKAGMSISHLAILTQAATEPTTNGIIAQRLQCAPGSLTKPIDELCHKKMLDRERDPGDRRRVWVRITSLGMESLQNLLK